MPMNSLNASAIEQLDGLFLLPGGCVEPGEAHLDKTLRELKEETGLHGASAL